MIGLVALMFLGPRKMPEMARKFGKFMNEFRGTANEFKETWRREVDFEGAAKEFDLNNLEAEVDAKRNQSVPALTPAAEIKPVDAETLEKLKASAARSSEEAATKLAAANDKKNWL